MADRVVARRILAGVLVLGAAVLVALASRFTLLEEQSATALVEEAPLVFRVRAQGTLESADRIVVSPPPIREQWDYNVVFLAPEGKPIAAGEPAVAFDTKRQRDDLQVQSAELAAAKKELEKVTLEEQERLDQLRLNQADVEVRMGKLRRKLDVPEDLYARGELERLRLEWDQAEREHALNTDLIAVQERNLAAKTEAAQAKVARLTAKVTEIQQAIAQLTVMAPRGGFVVYIPDWNNKKPAVSSSVWSGQQILEIADLSKMRVAAVVPEPDAGKVRPGQEVEIRLDANPDRLFRGRIDTLGRIFRTKSYDKPSIVFDAMVTIDEPDPELMRPGMAAEVVILAATEAPVLQVPENAVSYDGGGPAVTVRDAAGAERRVPVRLGWRAGEVVQVLEGLAKGDRVVVPEGGAA